MNILIFLLLAFSSASASILHRPQSFSPETLDQKIEHCSSVMQMEKEGNWALSFEYDHGQIVLMLQIIGAFPEQLSQEKRYFIHELKDRKECWTFIHGNQPRERTESIMSVAGSPLVVADATFHTIAVDEFISMLHGKKALFYTGAGISAGVVPTMKELMEALEFPPDFQSQENFFILAKKIVAHPEKYVKTMAHFYHACLFGNPTDAHYAIKNIVQLKDWGLITENLDFLHQRTGIKPLSHADNDWLRSHITIEDLTQIDVVLTVGLAHDECGFLAWYKQHKPDGVIIAINLQKPNYLDENDFFVSGDTQEILPQLAAGLNDPSSSEKLLLRSQPHYTPI